VRIDPGEAEGTAQEVTMLGFIIGTVCLIGLFKVLRRARGYHGGCGPGYYGHPRGFRGGRGGSRWLMRWLFERLETSPGQEKAIALALDLLHDNRNAVREEARQTRADVARAVAGGLIDDHTLDETFARHDRLLAQLRVSFVEAVKRVTETLDERQRKEAAGLIERGPWRGAAWRGPYRDDGPDGMWA
jgi:hypothetical protein